MKKLFTIPFIASLAFIMSCFGQGESFPSNLAPAEFNQKIKEHIIKEMKLNVYRYQLKYLSDTINS